LLSHFPPFTKCFVPAPATKMTPHRHTGVVIDYSDKCTCLFKVSESGHYLGLEKPNSTATPTRLNDMRSAFAFRVFSIPRAFFTDGISSYLQRFSPPQVHRSMPCRSLTQRCWMPAFVMLQTRFRTMTKRACSYMRWNVFPCTPSTYRTVLARTPRLIYFCRKFQNGDRKRGPVLSPGLVNIPG
jgi:hypothetical protein